MPDQPSRFTIQARVRYATWPGQTAVCAVLSSPKHSADQWYLANAETGKVSELRAFDIRQWRGGRR